jgi:hypothetical protein
MCRGGGLPLTNNNPYQQQNHTTSYVFVFHNNSTLPKYCNSALYSENKRYVLLKKKYFHARNTRRKKLSRIIISGQTIVIILTIQLKVSNYYKIKKVLFSSYIVHLNFVTCFCFATMRMFPRN